MFIASEFIVKFNKIFFFFFFFFFFNPCFITFCSTLSIHCIRNRRSMRIVILWRDTKMQYWNPKWLCISMTRFAFIRTLLYERKALKYLSNFSQKSSIVRVDLRLNRKLDWHVTCQLSINNTCQIVAGCLHKINSVVKPFVDYDRDSSMNYLNGSIKLINLYN